MSAGQQTPIPAPTSPAVATQEAPSGTPNHIDQAIAQLTDAAYASGALLGVPTSPVNANAPANGTLAGATTSSVKANAPVGWTPQLVIRLSLGIGFFAILLFVLITILLWRRRNAEQVLRTFGILVIIFAAIFLVIAGYSDSQITPVIGLLGTIAGYLLGRRIEPTSPEQPAPTSPAQPAPPSPEQPAPHDPSGNVIETHEQAGESKKT